MTPEALPPLRVEHEEAEDRWTLIGPGLRLILRREGERWVHALGLGDVGSDGIDLAASVEGGPDPARVMSPAYQDVQRHEGADGPCLLMTGQATPHHFSAVVGLRMGVAGSVELGFDVADRCRDAVEVLAATYLVGLDSGDLRDATPERIVWAGPSLRGGTLEFLADRSGWVSLAEAGRRACRVQALADLVPSTHTQRLHYRWVWTAAHSR